MHKRTEIVVVHSKNNKMGCAFRSTPLCAPLPLLCSPPGWLVLGKTRRFDDQLKITNDNLWLWHNSESFYSLDSFPCSSARSPTPKPAHPHAVIYSVFNKSRNTKKALWFNIFNPIFALSRVLLYAVTRSKFKLAPFMTSALCTFFFLTCYSAMGWVFPIPTDVCFLIKHLLGAKPTLKIQYFHRLCCHSALLPWSSLLNLPAQWPPQCVKSSWFKYWFHPRQTLSFRANRKHLGVWKKSFEDVTVAG